MIATPQPLPSLSGQVWSDERINELIKSVMIDQPNHTPRGLVRRVSYAIRDDYEHELAAARARMAELEAALALAPTDDIRQLLDFFLAERSFRPITRSLADRVQVWLDSVSGEPRPGTQGVPAR